MQEMWVQSLGCENFLEKEMATHCSILAWEIPWTEEPGGLQTIGSWRVKHNFSSVQFSSVPQSCPTLCDPMNCSTPGLPVLHQLPEFTQTHVHRVSDAIQPSHPLSSPSSPAPNPSQQQSLFQWVNSSHQVAKVLEFQLQHHPFQRNPRLATKQQQRVSMLQTADPDNMLPYMAKGTLQIYLRFKSIWDGEVILH